ncbi:MAG TPA: shikimate dehydrogenase [Polyangiaceae bacterium]|nr:shikimate dehydrogenase [Polyangiaceae bacterium]
MSQLFVLLGHPLAHSMSPAIHAAAYAVLGVPHRYELLDVPDEAALGVAVARLRRGELAGANVTVPWKRHALALADRSAASARDVGAANVLCRASDGAIEAHNTDVPALAAEISGLVSVPARQVLVLGNGGAALAAVAAARKLGALRVGVAARSWSLKAAHAEWKQADELLRLGAEVLPWPEPQGTGPAALLFAEFCRQTDVVLQATSAGMQGAASGSDVASIVPWSQLPNSALAYDLVYNPPETAFLHAARGVGMRASHGLGMLVGQAALAVQLWLGLLPPLEPLYAAAEHALAQRSRA